MTDFNEQYKKCVGWIQELNFQDIITSFKDIKIKNLDGESQKYLFKLLLHLSHSADRCCREHLFKELEIYTIAKIICDNMSSIPDKNKWFSAVYYILYYLLKNQFFKEAKDISSYLLPGKVIFIDDYYESSKYHQIALLWSTELLKELDVKIKDSKTEKNSIDEEFCSYIRYHLKVLKFCSENSGYTFRAVELYIKKLANVPLDVAFPCLLQVLKHLLNYISSWTKLSVVESYNLSICILGSACFKRNDILNNSNILKYFRQFDTYFLETFKTSLQCFDCYKLFREYSINLFETNFMSNEIGHLRFNKAFGILNILLSKYGETNNSVIETIAAISQSFDVLFTNWQNLVSKQLSNTIISNDDILCMGNFVKCLHRVLKNRPLSDSCTCKKSLESVKCLVKTDIYRTSIATSTYIRVITKFHKDFLNQEMFLLVKGLIEELLSVFYELNKSNCKNSSLMWDVCGRTIFNIGLISETKFPSELEELYEVLCKQIIQRDGLKSKISSFGLENPVATSLHRLCTVYFNQEKFRKAMTYAAYNALYSIYENKKKKAHDVWASLKLKLIDSKETQALTLLKCLKTDAEVVEKLGVIVNLEDYDMSDLCLRELRALYQVKGNMVLTMKRTLDELERRNSNAHFGRGVLLLCFHALQFNKREFISEYISKAISKLKNIKTKCVVTKCLLTNLSFFAIIEKLYVRSQAINEQIDDANFTTKAFKMLSGKHPDDETMDQNEVVPTYGGINIEEDKKCAQELGEVLTMWENCLFKDLTAIINDWEPKFTLETIIICGEYCRLYKFNNIEKKSWNIAHKLATSLNDYTTCIYVTSRSLSLRYICETWINDANKYVEKIKDSSVTAEIDITALYWLSLADFYCDCKKIEKAKALLEKVKMMPNYKLLVNSKLCIYAADIQFRNYHLLNTKTSQHEYCHLLVEIHYSMINIHDILTQDFCRFSNIKFQLFSCEQLFEIMCNSVIPMCSLFWYREINAHMLYGLKLAQKLGMTLRIAQFLKYFCYLDLLRLQIEDCETRLQDLEHILFLEQFQMSMKAEIKEEEYLKLESPPTLRDAPPVVSISLSKNNASPELKKKVFSPPDFFNHPSLCQCFICTNLHYQYLTFSCTHIRAQLYSLLKLTKEAQQHFHGASMIWLRLDQKDPAKNRESINYEWKRHHIFTIDYLMFLLDFSVFIIDFQSEQKDGALAVIEEILDIAVKNDLINHYVHVHATELYLEHHLYEKFHGSLSISVPLDIPITITNQPADGCTTPKQQVEKEPTHKIHRKKSPQAIPMIKIAETSDDENLCSNSGMPKSGAVTKQLPKRVNARNVRRKILVDEIEENMNGAEELVPPRRSTRQSRKLIN